jgi:hypothetical protein
VAVRGVAFVVAFAFVSAPLGAQAGERGAAGGFELLPLVAPRAPAARAVPAPGPAPRPVCVRLCDGYFFPVPASAGLTAEADAEAVCRALCPSAGVALYFLPSHSDRIEDAADARGEPYSALPAAFRYRSAAAPACGCRRAGEPGLAYWRDPTLKSGDAVMTADGVVVFRGGGGAPYGAEAFTPVEDAPLGATRRSELGALEPARDATESVEPAIGEARRAAGAAAGEIRFLAAPTAGGG